MLSIVIAVAASVLLFVASVLAVAALLVVRPGGGDASNVAPTGALPGRAGDDMAGDGPLSAVTDVGLGSGPGATCRGVPGRGFDVTAAGAGPGDQVTVAVELVDDSGVSHAQLVPAGAADAQGRVTASLPATLNGREVRSCTVTAVQLGDRVVYAGR
ncbi:MAG: hypothetical protein OEW29_01360 [Acidimicrobiia bacterium]|nr:hypothetical protein [Acidimicrobiia bacterium]MDH4365341.1 hypothetical protein [Acidimicrobiia bacterium]